MSEHKTAKYFKYALGEVLLVMIGILLALQVNNWNEERKEAIQEKLYLSRLLSDNQQDIAIFRKNIKDLEKGIETIKNFSEALKSELTNDTTLLQLTYDYFKYGSIYPIFVSSRSTYDDLWSTGNLKVISDNNLREQIVKHYARHDQIAERVKIGESWGLPVDAPFTINNYVMRFDPSTSFLFPETPLNDLSQELKDHKLDYITNAATHYWINKDCIAYLEELIIETESFIALLKESLK